MADKHQQEHANLSHPIVFSFADFSYWCYACDSYIVHKLLDHQKSHFYSEKFPEELSLD